MSKPTGTLLVVDDDAMNRDGLSRRLTRAGYVVLTAENGSEALEIIRVKHVDLVLLDVMMPVLSGIDTLRQLRQTHSVSELPVIMVTAKDASDDIVEALDVGANDYVTKPVDFPVVLARVRAQVTARRADPLTGLPNRVLFMEKLNHVWAQAQAAKSGSFAVLFLDLDRFKTVNDSLGHAAGDELLTEIARRLEASLRGTDQVARYEREHTLARMGGDEFTVLLTDITPERAWAVAERLRATVAEPVFLRNCEIASSVSVGIVADTAHYHSAEEIVRDADTAMYRAKELGKGRCQIFDPSMLAAAERRLQIESDLRHALERGEFEVYYQPILSLADARLSGFEALIRWNHPTRGLVSPGEFIPTAEETGSIVEIGLWVLFEACRQMHAWEAEFPESARMTISVNLSAKQCLQPNLVTEVRRILEDVGIAPWRLKLEITESFENSTTVAKVLGDLRALGVQLGLDDFGIGYSSLSYLQRLPFQTIKIDRTFVNGIQESGNTEIIRAIVSLAAGLEMNITAEGVETSDQIDRLKELACGFVQGFYFHRPLAASAASALLQGPSRPSTKVVASTTA
jgi:diguanylate cyclase (GGDEF)-like protein